MCISLPLSSTLEFPRSLPTLIVYFSHHCISVIVQIICPIHVTWTYFNSSSPSRCDFNFLVVYQSVPLLLFIVKGSDSGHFCRAISCSEFQHLLPTFTRVSFALHTTKPMFNQLHGNSGFTLRLPRGGWLNMILEVLWLRLCYYERRRNWGDGTRAVWAGRNCYCYQLRCASTQPAAFGVSGGFIPS